MSRFHLSTRTKIRVARSLHDFLTTARKWAGLEHQRVVCRRQGLRWELDLAEGIDLAIYLFGRFERQTSFTLQSLLSEGMTVIDLGANIGSHSLPMAKRVGARGRVYAIEPTDWAFAKLLRNLSLNPQLAETVVPIQAAFTDGVTPPPAGFYSSWDVTADEGVHPVHGGRIEIASNAAFMTFDEFIQSHRIDRVDLIKMDVDGFEVQLLTGAKESLKQFHPPILFEFCPHVLTEHKTSPERLLTILSDAGYSFFHRGMRLPRSHRELIASIPENGYLNILARP